MKITKNDGEIREVMDKVSGQSIDFWLYNLETSQFKDIDIPNMKKSFLPYKGHAGTKY